MADKLILVHDTKKPNRKPWVTDQWTLDFYHRTGKTNIVKYSDVHPDQEVIEIKKKGNVVEENRRVVVPKIIPAEPQVVTEKDKEVVKESDKTQVVSTNEKKAAKRKPRSGKNKK